MLRLAMIAGLALGLAGCGILFPPPTPRLTPTLEGSAGPGTAYLWLAADKDAYVICSLPGCADGDYNVGQTFHLALGHGAPGPDEKRSYVHFYLPGLPPGTQIEEAYINVYTEATLDGGTDNLPVPGLRSGDDWDPRTITWNNQPDPPGGGSELTLILRWRAWGESENIANLVRPFFPANRDDHKGFTFAQPLATRYVHREFRSDNNLQRRERDLDHAPRLLLKVSTEVALTPANVVLPPLPADTDLDEFLTGPEVLMVRIAGGPDWPASWEVARR